LLLLWSKDWLLGKRARLKNRLTISFGGKKKQILERPPKFDLAPAFGFFRDAPNTDGANVYF
jgi:hypothetical protein